MPSEYSKELQRLLGAKINCPFLNTAYDKQKAKDDYCKIMEENLKQEFSSIDSDNKEKKGYDKEQLTKARIGQGAFRRLLMEQRGCVCQLCNVSVPEVLRASHIKRWSDSKPEEKVDIQNGLLLCANHDALFDRYMITIDAEKENLEVSNLIKEDQILELYLSDAKRISMSNRMKTYMREHNRIFKNNN